MLPLEHLQKSNTTENIWLYILTILRKSPLHAWNLQTLIESEFGFKPGRITPYRVLYRLEIEGLVKSEEKERKRIYHITLKGEKELNGAILLYENILKKMKKSERNG
ncbi:hypothetical protein BWK69_01300 [Candidatus Parcubacteria bacterium A4]|nr:MAG: hypothetical protein BWK69_01300 [Candidatus Parcubacteria bacterium A4]